MPIFMKWPGVEGPVTAPGHERWFALESCQLFSHGQTATEVVVTKSPDSASAGLFRESLVGERRKVFIDFMTDTHVAPFKSLVLENTIILSYQASGFGTNSLMEHLSLKCSKITNAPKPRSASKNPKDSRERARWNLVVQSG